MMVLNMFGHKATDAEAQKSLQHLHNQFVASARAVRIGHEIDPNYMIGCMICGIMLYPGTCDPADILERSHQMEQNLFYCSDVQCRGKYGTYAKRIWKEYNVELDITEQDIIDLENGKMDLYTFSYYQS